MLQLTRCLRKQSVEVPDPDPQGGIAGLPVARPTRRLGRSLRRLIGRDHHVGGGRRRVADEAKRGNATASANRRRPAPRTSGWINSMYSSIRFSRISGGRSGWRDGRSGSILLDIEVAPVSRLLTLAVILMR
jgi:hypothetical protein